MTKKQLIIHIGRPKTGTSSIQHFLARNAEALNAEGAIYPRAGRRLPRERRLRVAHHDLAAACAARVDKEVCREIKRSFMDEVAGHDIVIISSESFSSLMNFGLLREFFDGFTQFEQRVIVYLREYLSNAVSSFQQKAHRHREFHVFSHFFSRATRIERFVARWTALGPIDFRPFDRERLAYRDVVADFLQSIELGLRPMSYADANPSIGGNLLYVKLVANRLGLPLLGYQRLLAAARTAPELRAPFFISDERASMIRGQNRYNETVMGIVGPLALKSYEDFPLPPTPETIDDDLASLRAFGDTSQVEAAIQAFSEDVSGWF